MGAVQGCIYFTGDNAAEEKQQLARWLSASAWCLRDHLLRKTDLESHLMGLLEPHEREAVMVNIPASFTPPPPENLESTSEASCIACS